VKIDEGITGADLLKQAETEEIDALIGGPPCQGFSTLGKRSLADHRNRLIWHFHRLVGELRPRAFLMENVDGLRVAKMTGESLSRTLACRFASHGYTVSYGMLLSANYGVPQLRRRVVFVGLRDDSRMFEFPVPTHDKQHWPTVWDAIGDLPSLRAGQTVTEYDRLPATELQKRLRGACATLTAHESPNHARHLIEAISHIPDGGNRRSIPPELQPKSGFHNSYARFRSDRPAIAVTTVMGKPSSTRCVHPFQNRAISPREGARLQTFEDSFVFTGGRWEQYEQIGNSVPVILAEQLGSQLANYLNDQKFNPSANDRLRSRSALLDSLFIRAEETPTLDGYDRSGQKTFLSESMGILAS